MLVLLLLRRRSQQPPGPAGDAEACLSPGGAPAPPKPIDEAERILTLQVALKCADLGNLAAHTPVYLQ